MNTAYRPKMMLITLGGSPDPLKKSIMEYKPDQIVFFASHGSVSLSGEILDALDYKPSVFFEITDNPNVMFTCYQSARKCVDRAKELKVSADEILVDYTGGTKVMTSALILASLGNHFRYNYVGGDLRNKNGLGTVKDGHEQMFVEMSPWSMFAEEERRQVVTLFNRKRFAATIEVIDLALSRKLPLQIKRYFEFLRPCSSGFMKWDQFEHADALSRLKKGDNHLTEYLEDYPDDHLYGFKLKLHECIEFLEKLLDETKNLQKFHLILIDDLMNNARRKMEDHLFDDASARIYRALELYGQILFEQEFGCSNSRVDPRIIPERIRDEFVRKFMDYHSKLLKLPLTATFEILREKNIEAGIRFFKWEKQIKNIQSNRNFSILAHGIKPVTQKAAGSIYQTVYDFVKPEIILDFPELS